jgi:hypothetical protein
VGRIRSVKPELLQQPWFATLTDAAARTYYGLLGVVDDCGRCPADPLFIGGQIFWGRQRSAAAITRQLAELERAGILRRYHARGGEYLEIVGWFEKGGPLYQQINKPQGERFPVPESFQDGNDSGPYTHPESVPDPIRSEGKGREGDLITAPPVASPGDPQVSFEIAQPTDPPPATKPRKQPAGDHQRVIAAFDQRYRDRYSRPPTWGAKQAGQVKALLSKHPADEIIRRTGILFDSPPAFLLNSPPDLGTLVQHFDKLVAPAMAANGTRAGPGARSPALQRLHDEIAAMEAAREADDDGRLAR